MNKIDIENLLTIMDNGAKEAFVSMTRENQLLVLLSIAMSNSNRIANVEKKQIETERDMKEYRRKREQRESNSDDEVMNTTQKIIKVLTEMESKKFNYAIWFRDRVMPQVITVITLALLALAFGYKP